VLPAAATGLVSAGLVLAVVGHQDIGAEAWVNVPLAVGFSTVAAGIWSTRPRTAGLRRLAVLYTVVGAASAFVLPAHGWAGADVPGADASAWLSNWVWAFGAAPLLGLGLVLYPDGTLPGRRWWLVPVLGIAATFTLALSGALMPGSLDALPRLQNPFGLGDRTSWGVVSDVASGMLLVAATLGLAAPVVKFRRADPGSDVRGQISGFCLAGGLVVVAASLPESDSVASMLLALTAGSILPFVVGMAVVRQRLLDQESDVDVLRRRVHRLSASRRDIVTEREEERLRLRRDLHDGLGPSLAAIGLGLRNLDPRSSADDFDHIRALADEVERAVAEVRRICDGLRPAALNELGLTNALAAAVHPLQRFGPDIAVVVDDLPPLTPAVEVAAYRIAMEATTNAVRHAGAANVRVNIGYEGGVTLSVVDDGDGLADDVHPGVGIRGMSDRAEELGGWFSVEANRPRGTVVRAWFPGLAT
jgi:signal transduction histidine kinase